MNTDTTESLVEELRQIQADFFATFGVTDIITNSKVFEVLIADTLNHKLIPGHSGSRDAKDKAGNEYEYKHYKESSSNHTWTFNDFSKTTIEKLTKVKSVIFAHIQDKNVPFPVFDWYYEVAGMIMSKYLAEATQKIKNNRKMINVGSKQIETNLALTKHETAGLCSGIYSEWIKKIVDTVLKIEKLVGTKNILTSNKFWEVLVALKLGHKVESEQAKHDAIDFFGNTYEYKVSKSSSWSFQDISKDVLKKYLNDKSIILATVDKNDFAVKRIYEADSKKVVRLLKQKLKAKQKRYAEQDKEVRRKQASLTAKDAKRIGAKLIYPLK
ncbi:MAG: hypothetical protein AAB364_01115 [Patescibacteria group bacterium]